ncbi:hypothetical protein ACFOWE_28250 [Planomonospora corallina]|uniref:Uncharacterized protein n=1 Tax=Planomonospora corallina TaxID=1806052 RepID=A0ABV8IGW7_9ACTN
MRRAVGTAAAAVAVVVLAGAGTRAARRLSAHRTRHTGRNRREADRWLQVTINRSPEEVMPEGRLPQPLVRLGDTIEVRARRAPGDRGTELAARLLEEVPRGVRGTAARLSGDDPRQEVRRALREAKSLLETGEVLRPDEPSTNRPTLTGKVVDLAVRRASGEGRL